MELKPFEVEEMGADRGWVRADRVMRDGFAAAAAEQIAEQLADGREDGAVKHDDRVYRWRWTAAAVERRVAAVRAEVARKVRAERGKKGGAVEWLATEEAQEMVAAAGWKGIPARELVDGIARGRVAAG